MSFVFCDTLKCKEYHKIVDVFDRKLTIRRVIYNVYLLVRISEAVIHEGKLKSHFLFLSVVSLVCDRYLLL